MNGRNWTLSKLIVWPFAGTSPWTEAKKEAQHVALDESLHSRPDTSTPYDSLTAREGLGLLQKLLKELPQTQQDIVQLREIEGKSYKEIAAILNLSEEQVKVYLFRARQRIKQKYTEIQGYGL